MAVPAADIAVTMVHKTLFGHLERSPWKLSCVQGRIVCACVYTDLQLINQPYSLETLRRP
jgi:hypothetical protein